MPDWMRRLLAMKGNGRFVCRMECGRQLAPVSFHSEWMFDEAGKRKDWHMQMRGAGAAFCERTSLMDLSRLVRDRLSARPQQGDVL